MTFEIGNKVFVKGYDWSANIIKELDNDMVFITTPSGMGRDVHKNDIREHLFGDILTEFPENKSIIVVTNYPNGIIAGVFEDTCYVTFENGSGRDFPFYNIRKI